MNSLIEQKAEVARLRDLYEKETDPMIKEYMRGSLATARLLHDIVECGVLEPERVKPKVYKRVKYVAIAIILAVVVWLVVGCHTMNGIGQDLSALSSPYIQEK